MSDAIRFVHLGIDLADQEAYSAAIEEFDRAIMLDSRNAQAYFERAMALLSLDRDAEAAADFDRALAIDPEYPGALDWRSRARESLGDHLGAAQDRLQDLRDHPDGPHGMGVSPQNWSDCAEAFLDAGQAERARELLEEYFEQHAHRVTQYACYETAPMRLLAKLLLQSGEPRPAVELARKAHASSHRCPIDFLILALALEAAGESEEAKTACRQAVEENDEMPGLAELRRRLGET